MKKSHEPTTPGSVDDFFTKIIEPGNQAGDSNRITDPEYKDRLKDILVKHKINPNEPPPPPPYCIWINDKPVAGYGAFSVVSGKAKSKKSFWLTLLTAAYLSGKNGTIKTEVDPNKSKVVYFDTEQGKYRAFKSYERITKLSGIDNPENLDVYEIRTLDHKTRMDLIECAVYNTAKLGLLIIDGARDILSSINDEEQATEVVHKLLKWSGELGIHIIVVLHENKGNDLLRGHFGTELMNKSELVYSVTKDQYSPAQSIIEYKASRDIEPEPIAMGIDPDGLPHIIEDWTPASESKPGKPRPIDFESGKHFEIIRTVFSNHREYSRDEFIDILKNSWGEQNNNFGNTIARQYLNFYYERGWIKKTGASNRVKYIMGDLDPGDESEFVPVTDVPF